MTLMKRLAEKATKEKEKLKAKNRQLLVHGTVIDVSAVLETIDIVDFNIKNNLRKMRKNRKKDKR